jgi:hypothetical protein
LQSGVSLNKPKASTALLRRALLVFNCELVGEAIKASFLDLAVVIDAKLGGLIAEVLHSLATFFISVRALAFSGLRVRPFDLWRVDFLRLNLEIFTLALDIRLAFALFIIR